MDRAVRSSIWASGGRRRNCNAAVPAHCVPRPLCVILDPCPPGPRVSEPRAFPTVVLLNRGKEPLNRLSQTHDMNPRLLGLVAPPPAVLFLVPPAHDGAERGPAGFT